MRKQAKFTSAAPLRRPAASLLALFVPFLPAAFAAPPSAPVVADAPADASLGRITFPNSGAAAAQPAFIRGVSALHSFWYEEAREAFQEATRLDPDFALGYWGEALTWNQTLWSQQTPENGRAALARIPSSARADERERALVDSVRVLFAENTDKPGRDAAYSAALEKLHLAHPGDDEIATLFALSLLGTVRSGETGFRRQARAGALALDVYNRNPQHPGAAHYIIHAFDDPEHAILALPAARRYAEIAPAAHHARHMPAHIFLQLGMWDECARSNLSAWEASDAWVTRKRLDPGLRDYHSYHWLVYTRLQQGRVDEARQRVEALRRRAADEGGGTLRFYHDTVAAYIVGTRSWALADTWFSLPPARQAGAGKSAPVEWCGAPPGPAAVTVPGATGGAIAHRQETVPLYVRALAAAELNRPEAEDLLEKLRATIDTAPDPFEQTLTRIKVLQVEARQGRVAGDTANALILLAGASKLESGLEKPSGPPLVIKPSHELYGEALFDAGLPEEAASQFRIALERQPNRADAVAGLARALAAGNGGATLPGHVH